MCTHTQSVRVDKEASIFSIGGYCAYNLISSDSGALFPCFCSCLTDIHITQNNSTYKLLEINKLHVKEKGL